MNTQYFKITRSGERANVSGVVSAAALIGCPVRVAKSASTELGLTATGTKLEKHPGTYGHILFLERPVVAAETALLKYENTTDVYPVVVGEQASATEALELEVEGGDTAGDGLAAYLDVASLDGTNAAGIKLTLNASGQWIAHTTAATQGVCGRLIGFLTPAYAGNIRASIEVYAEARIDAVV